MVERGGDEALGAALKALSDTSRRRIMSILVQEGAMTVGELAGRFEMSLAAVSKHIKVLEAAGLVSRRTEWREHVISAETEQLRVVEQWLSALRSNWATRLETLADIMKETGNDD